MNRAPFSHISHVNTLSFHLFIRSEYHTCYSLSYDDIRFIIQMHRANQVTSVVWYAGRLTGSELRTVTPMDSREQGSLSLVGLLLIEIYFHIITITFRTEHVHVVAKNRVDRVPIGLVIAFIVSGSLAHHASSVLEMFMMWERRRY